MDKSFILKNLTLLDLDKLYYDVMYQTFVEKEKIDEVCKNLSISKSTHTNILNECVARLECKWGTIVDMLLLNNNLNNINKIA
jgi:flavin reductase (DIM6/NTAB) family NADH-FMN oxidoreductase RutF